MRTLIAAAIVAGALLAGAGMSFADQPQASVTMCVNARTRVVTQPRAGGGRFTPVCPPGSFPEHIAKAPGAGG